MKLMADNATDVAPSHHNWRLIFPELIECRRASREPLPGGANICPRAPARGPPCSSETSSNNGIQEKQALRDQGNVAGMREKGKI
jgi:hypothetical protein